MIEIHELTPKTFKVAPSGKIAEDDFLRLTPTIDAAIAAHGQIRLMVDASDFTGWDNFAAFQRHAGFIRSHQKKIERLAVVTGHGWQEWLVDTMRMFLHPEAKAFAKDREADALQWLLSA
jgi:SpoIIAA-like